MNPLTMQADEDDARAIHRAIAVYQRINHEAFGEHLLPEGTSDTMAATLGEICRAWLEARGEWIHE